MDGDAGKRKRDDAAGAGEPPAAPVVKGRARSMWGKIGSAAAAAEVRPRVVDAAETETPVDGTPSVPDAPQAVDDVDLQQIPAKRRRVDSIKRDDAGGRHHAGASDLLRSLGVRGVDGEEEPQQQRRGRAGDDTTTTSSSFSVSSSADNARGGARVRGVRVLDAPGAQMDTGGPGAAPAAAAGQKPPAAHDTSRERPLLTILDDDFPTFNEKKAAERKESARPMPSEQLQAAPLSWDERMRVLWDVDTITRARLPRARRGSDDDDADGGSLIVVYAGGYPGAHVRAVATLYPEVEFIVVHPKQISGGVAGMPENVTQRLARFDAHEARGLRKSFGKNQRVVFIADVWSENARREGVPGVAGKMADMTAQKEWVRALAPAVYGLKFYLPVGAGHAREYAYLKGDVVLPSWGPQDAYECRLIGKLNPGATALPEIEYDCLRYSRQMAFFRKIARARKYVRYHPNNPTAEMHVTIDGADWRYDASSEIATLAAYLDHTRVVCDTPDDRAVAVTAASNRLSGLLGYTLKTHPARAARSATGPGGAAGYGGGASTVSAGGRARRAAPQSDVEKYLASLMGQ